MYQFACLIAQAHFVIVQVIPGRDFFWLPAWEQCCPYYQVGLGRTFSCVVLCHPSHIAPSQRHTATARRRPSTRSRWLPHNGKPSCRPVKIMAANFND